MTQRERERILKEIAIRNKLSSWLIEFIDLIIQTHPSVSSAPDVTAYLNEAKKRYDIDP